MLANDADANGVIDLQANDSLTYTPDEGYAGTDAFTYQASNGDKLSNLVTVTIQVTDQVFTLYLPAISQP
ncbi:MAG: hypothetical protein Fur0021_20170 [Candidatus Promineifilaceae bacterium]